MATDILVPTLGESVSSATVARWLKQAGEAVAADEPLVELETDKVTVEVNAPAAGVLEAIAVPAGTEVGPGAVLGSIAAGAAAATRPAAPPTAAAKPVGTGGGSVAQAEAHGAAPGGHAPMPAAAKLMADHALSPAQIGAGSAKDGRIAKGDVLDFLARAAAAPAAAGTAPAARPARALEAGEERVKMTRLRATIARRLKEAQNTAAMLTTFNEVDMSAVLGLRAEYKDAFEKRHGVKLGFMSFFVKACVAALQEFPAVNAEIEGDEVIYRSFVHMGIAVGGPNGLVVPVLRNADAMGFAEIEKRIADFGKRVRDGQLRLDEMAGGSFTITNGGIYGSLMSTPILNPPQSGILGMHKIQERPMVVGKSIEARPMMYLALSYDHRIVDGKEAVSFLVRVKDAIEDPRRLMLGV
ncbi:MAG: 2-oxoglutarate dehydrogenase complex dihydrolipoyllysine-residue succinyltransferase [Rubritepida sp.]|jgi:2-oxoglutarate dehydrogenase E2 component (dihydrolipoamide succinyltransferase)|nr:2-oxoglutarate dehydrogenase complex dihydrolipoyllysine-residue succinyltransferase [Rubritepida sp.]MCU0945432.1 2-oxoglutarate dehydrogenase complex dihydrolipoyllysine-residue succinyltransferase [Rubritepida sp.]